MFPCSFAWVKEGTGHEEYRRKNHQKVAIAKPLTDNSPEDGAFL
jgi:hypothetical protein